MKLFKKAVQFNLNYKKRVYENWW